jgi:sporulation protein YlmC with PRC-barrel domain
MTTPKEGISMRSPEVMNRFAELRGAPVLGSDGHKMGTVEHLYFDIDNDEPKWLGLKPGVLGGRLVFVPLQGAEIEGNTIQVRFTKEQVEGSPEVFPDAISRHAEQELLAHYGMGSSRRVSPSTPASAVGSGRPAAGSDPGSYVKAAPGTGPPSLFSVLAGDESVGAGAAVAGIASRVAVQAVAAALSLSRCPGPCLP